MLYSFVLGAYLWPKSVLPGFNISVSMYCPPEVQVLSDRCLKFLLCGYIIFGKDCEI